MSWQRYCTASRSPVMLLVAFFLLSLLKNQIQYLHPNINKCDPVSSFFTLSQCMHGCAIERCWPVWPNTAWACWNWIHTQWAGDIPTFWDQPPIHLRLSEYPPVEFYCRLIQWRIRKPTADSFSGTHALLQLLNPLSLFRRVLKGNLTLFETHLPGLHQELWYRPTLPTTFTTTAHCKTIHMGIFNLHQMWPQDLRECEWKQEPRVRRFLKWFQPI